MLSTDEDIELSRQLQAGSERALEEIFARYQPLMLDRAYFYLRDVRASEDAVQDCFVKLWDSRKRLHIETSLRAYLLKMVTSRSLDKLKRENIEKTYLDHAAHSTPVNTDTPPLENKELGDLIKKAIENIPAASYRRAFEMLYLQQKSISEIARETNTNVQVVRNQVHRALKYLRVNLKKFDC